MESRRLVCVYVEADSWRILGVGSPGKTYEVPSCLLLLAFMIEAAG